MKLIFYFTLLMFGTITFAGEVIKCGANELKADWANGSALVFSVSVGKPATIYYNPESGFCLSPDKTNKECSLKGYSHEITVRTYTTVNKNNGARITIALKDQTVSESQLDGMGNLFGSLAGVSIQCILE